MSDSDGAGAGRFRSGGRWGSVCGAGFFFSARALRARRSVTAGSVTRRRRRRKKKKKEKKKN